jgi:hypothetical protein
MATEGRFVSPSAACLCVSQDAPCLIRRLQRQPVSSANSLIGLACRVTKDSLNVDFFSGSKFEETLALNLQKLSMSGDVRNVSVPEFLLRVDIFNIGKEGFLPI